MATTIITQEDVDLATSEYKRSNTICHSCVLFQVAKRLGFKPVVVYLDVIFYEGQANSTPHNALNITSKGSSLWPLLVGLEVTLPGPV